MAAGIGTVIDGKYIILEQIGKGGMSVVYLAIDNRLNKKWAVKEIKKILQSEDKSAAANRLITEAEFMKRLDHPTLPGIVDIIESEDELYVVMDYIEGESLDKVLKKYGAQPEEKVIGWAVQLCGVLGYLHSLDPPIIYRDMKPANIMLKPDGNIKVIDLGIAREYKENSMMDTTVLGTAGYAAPEQYGSRQTDSRSDIYALGMTLHHLITGIDPRNPDYEYAPVRQWVPGLSEGVEIIIDKCTALLPENRYQSCNELMYDLENTKWVEKRVSGRRRIRVLMFMLSMAMAIIFTIVGISVRILEVQAINRSYNKKLNISESTQYEIRIKTYMEAIDIIPGDTRGYIKLLQAYMDNGIFGDKESNIFTAKYNENKDKFDTDSSGYLDLSYHAGNIYFYLYSGGDGAFRTRILKSYPYFKIIATAANKKYKYSSISYSYYIIGKFYSEYVENAATDKEPEKGVYVNLINSLNDCLNNIDDYKYDDASYIRLTMYDEIEKLIFEYRRGFASAEVEMEDVISILDKIQSDTDKMQVTRPKSIELRKEILGQYQWFTDGIRYSYENINVGG